MVDYFGFLKIKRKTFKIRPVDERVKDYNEVFIIPNNEHTKEQASRCMNCGTPFCNWGCPLGNYIPEWNYYANQGKWEQAFYLLNSTNVLPEITGRVCPAPCEYSCVLGINDDPITIRENELNIIEEAFEKKYIKPIKNIKRTGKRVAIIGSGPAGISAAAILNYYGHYVTVYEKYPKVGGFLRYGIPDFKLNKKILDRRINLLIEEGIRFITNTEIGKSLPIENIIDKYDAIVIAIGCREKRDLNIPGRNLKGIYHAVDFLTQANKKISGDNIEGDIIDTKDKNVIVIGGGDTGADCVGVACRQGAKSIYQIEIMPQPPKCRTDDMPWPKYPLIFKTSTSHEEGNVIRLWSTMTKEFIGDNGGIKKIKFSKCEMIKYPKIQFKEISCSDFELPADIVILSLGFTGPEKNLIEKLNLKIDNFGFIFRNENNLTSINKIFVAGDAARGPSLVVWAIKEGIDTAKFVHNFLINQ